MADDETTTNTQMTEVKTMWSETLLEALYVAFEKNKGDATIKGVVRDLKEKGYENDYLIEKVEKKVGPAAANRLKLILAGKSSAASASAKAKTKESGGLVGKIKGIFK